MNDEMTEGPRWVLVEGPGPGDAEFLGRRPLAVVAADKALENCVYEKVKR